MALAIPETPLTASGGVAWPWVSSPQQTTLPVTVWIAQLCLPARGDVGRSPRNTVDGVGGRRLAPGVVAPADDVTRACLDRAAVSVARGDVGRGPPKSRWAPPGPRSCHPSR